MARKQRTVVEVKCDRCTRVEEREDDKAEAFTAFEGRMFGIAVYFDDLCGPCHHTVKNHLEQIGKKLEGMSPDRGRVTKGSEDGVTGGGPPQGEGRSIPVTSEDLKAGSAKSEPDILTKR